MTERFLVFAGDQYYPYGGYWDYRGGFASIDLAKNHLLAHRGYDWWHVVDSETQQIVLDSSDIDATL